MMNVIFAGIILFSFVFAALTGRMPQLSEAAMGQAGEAVTLVLSLTGMLCLWSGLMKIAQESGPHRIALPPALSGHKTPFQGSAPQRRGGELPSP